MNEYGTGNSIAFPAEFIPSNGQGDPQLPGSPIIRATEFQRVSRRVAPAYHSDAAALTQNRQNSVDEGNHSINHVNGDSSYDDVASYVSRQTSPPQTSPPNVPIPPLPDVAPSPPPVAINTSSRATPSPAARHNRESQPLPMLPQGSSSRAPERTQTPPPPLPVQQGNKILFYGTLVVRTFSL